MFMRIVNIMITGMSYAVLVLGVLTVVSLLITWLYILEKRLSANIFGQGVFFEFMVKKIREKHTKKKTYQGCYV